MCRVFIRTLFKAGYSPGIRIEYDSNLWRELTSTIGHLCNVLRAVSLTFPGNLWRDGGANPSFGFFKFQSIMGHVAKRASVLKRKKSKNKMDTCASPPVTTAATAECSNTQSSVSQATNSAAASVGSAEMVSSVSANTTRRDSENDLVFYIEEPRAG